MAIAVADGLDRTSAEGHGLGGIGNELVVLCVAGLGRGESELQSGIQIERRRLQAASAIASGRPRRKAAPGVGAGLEGGDGRNVGLRRVVFQVMIEEGAQDVGAEVESGVAIEVECAEGAPIVNFLAVMPGAKD